MQGVLKDIVANKHREVAEAKERLSLSELKALCLDKPRPKDFFIALASTTSPRIIAECKRKSPSKGVLLEDYDPVAIASDYERGGAAAVSVLTDYEYFGGKLEDLEEVSSSVQIPCLRKDFIIDEYQIYEAYRHGASSFLLLASVLDTIMLQYFLEVGRDLGMEALLEVHSPNELSSALKTDAKIIGMNTRDLRTMQIDPSLAHAMLAGLNPEVRNSRIFVLESGVKQKEQVRDGYKLGFKAFLVGESLMQANDRPALLQSFIHSGV